MPKSKKQQTGLLDSWGRRNRKLVDKTCETCGKTYRPKSSKSRFCSRSCLWKKNGGHNKKPESWWTNPRGYIEGRIWLPDGTQIYVKKHRFIAEGIIGRPLRPTEDVHHVDGNKANNDPSNLEIIEHGKHSTISNMKRKYKKGYRLNLTDAQRRERSLRAIAQQLAKMGRAAIAKARGEK